MQKVCIVIPLYNEGVRFNRVQFEHFLSTRDCSFILVNDGSTDQTKLILENLSLGFCDLVKVIHLEKNSGKSQAVRIGMLEALQWKEFDHIGFWDADFSTPLNEIEHLLDAFKNTAITVAIGSRVKRLGSQIHRSKIRHILGRIFMTFVNLRTTDLRGNNNFN
jgi:dolichyl-phosphate beta-glucosyltransferase